MKLRIKVFSMLKSVEVDGGTIIKLLKTAPSGLNFSLASKMKMTRASG